MKTSHVAGLRSTSWYQFREVAWDLTREVQSHVTQKLGQVSKIHDDQRILSPKNHYSHLPSPTKRRRRRRHFERDSVFLTLKDSWPWPQLWPGCEVYRRLALVDLCLHTEFHSNLSFLWTTDERTEIGFIRSTLSRSRPENVVNVICFQFSSSSLPYYGE